MNDILRDNEGIYRKAQIDQGEKKKKKASDSENPVKDKAVRAAKLEEQYEFRDILPDEAAQAGEIEQICFPPNEACTRERIAERAAAATRLFLVAVDKQTGKLAGFLNGIAVNESKFRDDFFTDAQLHDPNGKNVMLLGLDVLPEHRQKGLASEIVRRYCEREKAKGREKLFLTCLPERVQMYENMGFRHIGESASVWGGEIWQEMDISL